MRMTNAEQARFEKELKAIVDAAPDGLLLEKPRFQLSGEIMPESLLREKPDMSYSELP